MNGTHRDPWPPAHCPLMECPATRPQPQSAPRFPSAMSGRAQRDILGQQVHCSPISTPKAIVPKPVWEPQLLPLTRAGPGSLGDEGGSGEPSASRLAVGDGPDPIPSNKQTARRLGTQPTPIRGHQVLTYPADFPGLYLPNE